MLGLFELSKRLGVLDAVAGGFEDFPLLAGYMPTFPFAVRGLCEVEAGGFDGKFLVTGSACTGFLLGRVLLVPVGGGLDGIVDAEVGFGDALIAVDGSALAAPEVEDTGLGAFAGVVFALVAFTAVFFCVPPLTGPSAAIEFCTVWP